MKTTISTILFDLGGVILNLDYDLTAKAFKKIGNENFDDLYSQAQQNSTFDLFETGKISEEKFRAYFRSVLGEQLSNEAIDDSWNAMLLDLPKERLDLLAELKKKYKIYLFSNTNAIHYKKFRADLKKHHGSENLLETIFDKTYYSHLIEMRKPNPSAFNFILNDVSLQAEEVLFIDDSIQHIKGAESIGINTIHLVDSDIITLLKDLV